MSNNLSQLRDHLKAMFQFDNNDLDFGLFRILKLKRKEVEAFIDTELEQIVQEALADASQKQKEFRLAELTGFVKEKGSQDEIRLLDDLSGNREQLINFINYKNPANRDDLLAALDAAVSDDLADDLADRIYNHVLRFFERYYRDGDFGYNDRSLATYEVDYPPAVADYDGSDVLFHWKHKDSYYIKTANGFGSVPFTTDDGTRIVYRLEAGVGSATGIAQNSNKDTQQKHFALHRIEQDKEGTWHVVFRLAQASTSKVEIYRSMLKEIFGVEEGVDKYLHKKPGKNEDPPGKPLFNDLVDDYDKVENGQLKGMGKLRLPADKVLEELAKRDEFRDLGSNKDARKAALERDETVRRLLAFDKALNAFYVGTDSDYFVHKDLHGFLKREQKRYIQNVIFSDLDAFLDFEVDNTAVIIARAFRHVTDRLIEFLSAVEEFQKNLFLMKKKVVETGYLISVGKITEAVTDPDAQREILEQIVANEAQVREWKETFGVEITNTAQLTLQSPTLPVDTRHFDDAFTDRILAAFDDLDAEITGLLINSENFQALRLLENRYRGQVKCIYIDPPYNTSEDGFLYKDRFQHSSWLSMMEDRVRVGAIFLTSEGSYWSTIDDNEVFRLHALLNQIYGENNFVAQIVWQKRTSPDSRSILGAAHDYIFAYAKDLVSFKSVKHLVPLSEGRKKDYTNPDDDPRGPWASVDLTGQIGHATPDQFFEVTTPSGMRYKPPEGRCWALTESTFFKLVNEGRIWFGMDGSSRPRLKKYLKDADGMAAWTWWQNNEVGHNQEAKKELISILGAQKAFETPKPTRLIERIIELAEGDSETGIILDYFSGSGTTGHAVLKLNKEDGGQRKFILVEMGDYFDTVLKERIRRVMYSQNWKDGKPIEDQVDGTIGIVKYQRLEQYEDVLNNLDLTGANPLPEGVPLRYLYRPAEQRVRQSLDLSRPFGCAIRYGKDNTEGAVDVLETYCYLKGLPIRQRRRYNLNGRIYRVVRSGPHLVVLRDIKTGEDDTDALKTILDDFEGVEVLHVNHDVDRRKLEDWKLHLRLITPDAFDDGATWS